MVRKVRRAPTALALLAEAGIKYEPALLVSKDAVKTPESTASIMMATIPVAAREDVAEDKSSAVADSEAEWESYSDEATGAAHYYNKRRRRSTWTDPGECHISVRLLIAHYVTKTRTATAGTEPKGLETVSASSSAAEEIELAELFESAAADELVSSNLMHEPAVSFRGVSL